MTAEMAYVLLGSVVAVGGLTAVILLAEQAEARE